MLLKSGRAVILPATHHSEDTDFVHPPQLRSLPLPGCGAGKPRHLDTVAIHYSNATVTPTFQLDPISSVHGSEGPVDRMTLTLSAGEIEVEVPHPQNGVVTRGKPRGPIPGNIHPATDQARAAELFQIGIRIVSPVEERERLPGTGHSYVAQAPLRLRRTVAIVLSPSTAEQHDMGELESLGGMHGSDQHSFSNYVGPRVAG